MFDFISDVVLMAVTVFGSYLWKKMFPKQFNRRAKSATHIKLPDRRYTYFNWLSSDIIAMANTYSLRCFILGISPFVLLGVLVYLLWFEFV